MHDLAGDIRWNGKADADVAAAAGEDRGVEPDQFTLKIDQSAARVAGVDRGIGLNVVLEAVRIADARTAGGADDAGGDGMA